MITREKFDKMRSFVASKVIILMVSFNKLLNYIP